ncbi:MAG: hydrogenase maturation protein [Elusimicrobia bacterium]|nr:hydrogenase maturation protein [Elusimicrobiota bacterium]MBK7208684.1 hydrogenase maturation protein [Elusimicrobiota bacterium]MBK7575557.1 hydrogenase maturation protein [Elusimicrobiota bacterium]MBK8127114.1 hydrogenase maturation protein [Elusimicrobiota bacterium]MBK8424275.1 hydrogenase maturation protein [Elusimicrobiota bacterium]
MKILLLCHSFNSLAQRLHVELRERGHEATVEFDVSDAVTEEAVRLFRPDVVLAPFLKRAIPESVWRGLPCLVVHPGIIGDRGPSALDWAVLRGEGEWGATVLQANGVFDGGDVWAEKCFKMREATKGSLYRREVAEAAVAAVLEALDKFADGARPAPLDYSRPGVHGRPLPPCRSADRAVDWRRHGVEEVLRRVRASDGIPGAPGNLAGISLRLFDAHPATGSPRRVLKPDDAGKILARRLGAVLVGAADGAVWIGRLRPEPDGSGPPPLKLPAVRVLGVAVLAGVPTAGPEEGLPDMSYEERNGVGWIRFPFYNGAMGTADCRRLRGLLRRAKKGPAKVLVLAGGPDYWSNGIDLARIEAAESPAEESLRNIIAMDDLALEILTTTDQLVVSALGGDAGAGGAFLALAADLVWMRTGAIINPHYAAMGNLFGSEYWTYTLPRRVGSERAGELASVLWPVGSAQARRWGLADDAFGGNVEDFFAEAHRRALDLAKDPVLVRLIDEKRVRRAAEEAAKPLAEYRREELDRMRMNFFGFDPSYHVARYNFIRKIPKSRTPSHLAVHRRILRGV